MILSRNRRGTATDFMVDIFAFFFYILMLIVFVLIFSITFGGCNNLKPSNAGLISSLESQLSNEQVLSNYFRTNISLGDRELSFSELIAESCLNNDFELLKAKTEQLFEKEINKAVAWQAASSPKYQRFKVELYLKCKPSSRTRILIYRSDKSFGCTLEVECPDTNDKILALPLPSKTGQSVDNYATLIMNNCEYTSPSNSYSLTQEMREYLRSRCI